MVILGFAIVSFYVGYIDLTIIATLLLTSLIYMQGESSNHNIVAVKQLFMKTQQASVEFINEIVLIINLQH